MILSGIVSGWSCGFGWYGETFVHGVLCGLVFYSDWLSIVAVCHGGSLGLSSSLRCNAEYCVEIGCLMLDSDIVFSEMGGAYKHAVGL